MPRYIASAASVTASVTASAVETAASTDDDTACPADGASRLSQSTESDRKGTLPGTMVATCQG